MVINNLCNWIISCYVILPTLIPPLLQILKLFSHSLSCIFLSLSKYINFDAGPFDPLQHRNIFYPTCFVLFLSFTLKKLILLVLFIFLFSIILTISRSTQFLQWHFLELASMLLTLIWGNLVFLWFNWLPLIGANIALWHWESLSLITSRYTFAMLSYGRFLFNI